jgi:hypothetical protein
MKFLELVIYEFRKVYRSKSFVFFFLSIFLINGALFIYTQYQNNSMLLKHINAYQQLHDKYSDMDIETSYTSIKDMLIRIDVYGDLSTLTTMAKDHELDISDEFERIREQYPALVEEYQNGTMQLITGEIHTDRILVERLYRDIAHVYTYEDYLNIVDEQAEMISDFSIFSKSGTFSKRNIIRTVRDFDPLHGINLPYAKLDAFSAVATFPMTDIFMLFGLFIYCVALIVREKDREIFPLLKSCKYGGASLIGAKLFFLGVNSILMVLLLYFTNYAIAATLYGPSDMGAPIQCSILFKQCTILINLWQFICAAILIKAASIFLIGLIFITLIMAIRSTILSYAAISVLLAVEYAAWSLIGVSSWANHLKFINIFSMLDASGLFANYVNLNFFGYPFSVMRLIFYLLPSLSLLGCWYVMTTYLKGSQFTLPLLERLVDLIRRRISYISLHSSLFFHELYKAMVTHKGAIILLALAVFTIHRASNTFVLFPRDVQVYKSYLQDWEGELTSETIEKVQEEQAFFDTIGQRMAELSESKAAGNISESECEGSINKLLMYQDKQEGFYRVYEQVMYLEAIHVATGIRVWLLDTIGYNRLFSINSKTEEVTNILLILMILSLLISPTYAYDNQKKLGNVINSCRRGSGNLAIIKIMSATLLALISMIIVNGTELWMIERLYGLPGLMAPIQSIEAFGGVPFNVSILEYILLVNAIRFIGILAMALLIIIVSRYSNSIAAASAISLAVTCIPALLYLFGFKYTFWTRLLSVLSGNALFINIDSYGFVHSIMYIAVNILVLAVEIFLLVYGNRFREKLHIWRVKAVQNGIPI